VAERAVRVFEALAEAEARVHGAESAETVHFHEVGAIDALVDVVGAVAGLDALGIASVSCGPITVGDGVIEGSHGALPAPGPATLELLRGFELRQRPGAHELATPTGAALVRVLAGAASRPAPPMRLEAVGYGAGAADPPGHPNVLRLWVGASVAAGDRGPRQEAVLELETQIDDCSPELLATAREALLRAGALDVISVPCHMKKGRTGLWIQVLARPQDAARLERLLFEETSTFGVRRRLCERSVLERRSVTVPIEGIAVRVKLGLLEGRIVTRSPELEDVRAVARRLERPVREIYERACAAAAALGPG
ncbi:MAG: nickel pincer cofactor biosynthesis protein LarC, partial [Planctomycetota bacterium]